MQTPFDLARQAFMQGVAAFGAGRLEEADSAFVASLAALPGRPSTLANLAAVRIRLGRPAEALPMLDQSLAQDERAPDAWCHRGEALALLGRAAEALAAYDRALALEPNNAAARFQRTTPLSALGRHAEVLAALDALLAGRPGHLESWLRRGLTLQALERPADALASFERALQVDATSALAWSQRGAILKDMQRLPEAADCFRQALAHGGDAELNGYYLASVQGAHDEAAPQAAPRHYVEGLFDSYAEGFDAHLTQVLGYRTPSVLAAQLPAGRRFARALDLGCGTGLMGPLLEPVVDVLDGVDLSSLMLEKARALGLYRELAHGDVVEFMQAAAQRGQRWDLVVAADVFVYIGALGPVFAAVAATLAPGGVFAFSLEEAEAGRELELRASSRYAHSEAYVRGLAAAHGFVVEALRRDTLRHDQRRPIPGLCVRLAPA